MGPRSARAMGDQILGRKGWIEKVADLSSPYRATDGVTSQALRGGANERSRLADLRCRIDDESHDFLLAFRRSAVSNVDEPPPGRKGDRPNDETKVAEESPTWKREYR